ncbi:hypothetical protein G9P44_004289 [Scheffersomyces stipitis]|nr:hypothetical protein G9P44_004289 [Scheffersomyces stipitis]
MRLSSALLVSVVASSALAALVADSADAGVAVGAAAAPLIASEDENPDIIAPKKNNNRLGVQSVIDEDNDPTTANAKGSMEPYGASSADSSSDDEDSDGSHNSFFMSVSMIIVSEIGDKTFLIAALMAMRNSRLVVFSAAFASLVVMTVLSGIVGHALPSLISRRLTQFLASILFLVFGAKLLNEGLAMSKELGVDEELQEVEDEIASSKLNAQMDDVEGGASEISAQKQWYIEIGGQIKDLASFVLSPIWIQVFVMTFLGEWGDRSQIATIAMAAGSDYWFVILGAIVGHGLCTAAACIGGKLLAKKISMRNVTLGGAAAFFVFAILYFYQAYYDIEG